MRVMALEGQGVVQANAGGRHTLVLSASNEVWGFGCNESGQLGPVGAGACQLSPQRIEGLPQGVATLFVVAGGDHSLVVVSTTPADATEGDSEAPVVGPCRSRPHGQQYLPLAVPLFSQLLPEVRAAAAAAPGQAKQAVEAAREAVETAFACPAFLLESLSPGPSPAGTTTVDLLLAGEAYEALLRLSMTHTEVASTLGSACLGLLDGERVPRIGSVFLITFKLNSSLENFSLYFLSQFFGH
jgi:hypothetical protein